jgi:hypothetical protein
MTKSIKNYTTEIKVEKTVAEIEKCLAKNGVTSIYKMYSEDGSPTGIAFKIWIPDKEKEFAFRLPMEEEKVFALIKNSRVEKRYRSIEQARRTGWRIIKDWIESQMALVSINLVKLEQVFLPYMYDQVNNETLFDKLERRDYNLQIENKNDETKEI